MPIVLNGTTGITTPDVDSTADISANGLTVGRGAGAVSSNTAVGASALAANTAGENTVAIGRQTLQANTTGQQNTAIGADALKANTTGTNNVAIGYVALTANTTADDNVALGVSALNTNTTGAGNHGIGRSALRFNTTGSNSTAVGMDALRNNTTASNNTAVGYQAGYSNTTASSQTFVGYQAGYNTTAQGNTFVGKEAGQANTTGQANTYIGNNSGVLMTTGSKNTILGIFNGNQGGLNILTASNNIVLSDGDGNPRYVYSGSAGSHFFTNGEGTPSYGGDAVIVPTYNGNQRPGFRSYDVSSAAQTNNAWSIFRNGNQVGTVTTTLSSTAYNTSSDYRLKENIAPMTGALQKVALLKPVTYTWKSTGETDEGFIAHELQAVCPSAVTGEKDAVDAEGNPQYQGIDTSFLVATLTAAIQEQQAIIESLTARVVALEQA